MMSRTALALLALAACGAPDPATDAAPAVDGAADSAALVGGVDVYLIALQSNAVGGALASDLPSALAAYADPFPAVQQAYQLNCPTDGIDGACSSVSGWADLAPRSPGGYLGVELSLGRRLDELRAAPVAILKTATNGTNLQTQWEPDAPGGVWQWHYMTRAIDARIAELPAGSHIAGVVLIGLEGDAGTPLSARSADDDLAWWILAFRARYGAVPVAIAELSAPGLPYTADVSEREWRVPALVPDVRVIETGDLAYRDGIQHYTAASYVELGLRLADALGGLP